MTKRERDDRNRVNNQLIALGFSQNECNKLRRISNTLRRWYMLECGTENDFGTQFAIEYGRMEKSLFVADPDGKPYLRTSYVDRHDGGFCVAHNRIADAETAAVKRLDKIIEDHNVAGKPLVAYYLQKDPRGAALYIISMSRYEDFCKQTNTKPDGNFDAIYPSVGICVS